MDQSNQPSNNIDRSVGKDVSREKLFSFSFLVITISFAVETLGFSMVSAHIASYAKEIGVAGKLLGIFPGMMSLAALFCRPVAGWISDHFNRRSVIKLMILSLTLVFLGYTFSINPLMLITVRILHGIAFSIFTTTSMSSVADVLPKEKLVQGTAYYALAGGIVNSFAPSVGVWIRTNFGYRWMFISVMILYGISFILFALLPKQESTQRRASGNSSLSLKNIIAVEIIPLALLICCVAVANGALNGFVLIYAEGRGISGGSLFFTAGAIVSLATKPVLSRLSRRVNPYVLLFAGMINIMLTLILLSAAAKTVTVVIAGAISGCGYSACMPIIQGLVLGSVSESRRGIASGTFYIGLDAGNFLGPTILGYIASWFAYDYGKGFLVLNISLVLGIVIVILRLRKKKLPE